MLREAPERILCASVQTHEVRVLRGRLPTDSVHQKPEVPGESARSRPPEGAAQAGVTICGDRQRSGVSSRIASAIARSAHGSRTPVNASGASARRPPL